MAQILAYSGSHHHNIPTALTSAVSTTGLRLMTKVPHGTGCARSTTKPCLQQKHMVTCRKEPDCYNPAVQEIGGALDL